MPAPAGSPRARACRPAKGAATVLWCHRRPRVAADASASLCARPALPRPQRSPGALPKPPGDPMGDISPCGDEEADASAEFASLNLNCYQKDSILCMKSHVVFERSLILAEAGSNPRVFRLRCRHLCHGAPQLRLIGEDWLRSLKRLDLQVCFRPRADAACRPSEV